jgi:hypothetical protein
MGDEETTHWRNPNLPKGMDLEELEEDVFGRGLKRPARNTQNDKDATSLETHVPAENTNESNIGVEQKGVGSSPMLTTSKTTKAGRSGISDPAARTAAADFFRSLQVFQGLEDDSVCALVDAVRPLRVPPGQYVIRAGDEGDSMFFIQDGKCVVEFNGCVVDCQSTGKFFGEVALTVSEKRIASVRSDGSLLDAAQPALLLQLMRSDFEVLLEEYAGLKKRFAFIGQVLSLLGFTSTKVQIPTNLMWMPDARPQPS